MTPTVALLVVYRKKATKLEDESGFRTDPACARFLRDTRFTLTPNYLTNIELIKLTLKELTFLNKLNISIIIKLYNVDRSTLSRRHRRLTNPKSNYHENEQLLSNQQELDLVKYISKRTEMGLPPTTAMVRNFAEQIVGKRPGNGWS